MSISIMSQVWKQTPVRDGREVLGLLALADWADDYGGAYPAYDILAHKMRCSERQAMRVIANLSKAGEVYRLPEKARRKAFFNSNLFVVLSGCHHESEVAERIYNAAKGKGIKIAKEEIPTKDIMKKRITYLSKHPLIPSPRSSEGDTYDTPNIEGGDVDDTPKGDTYDTHDLTHMSPNTSYIRQEDTSINGGGIDPAPLATPLSAPDIAAAVLKDLETAQRQRGMEVQANETAILSAFQRFNKSIKEKGGGLTPITGTAKIARDLALRGETEATMKAAWDTCKTNGIKPMGAFMKWIQEGYLPPQQEGHETKVVDGVVSVWVEGQGWMEIGGKAQ